MTHATPDDRAAKVAALHARLESAVADLATSAGWTAYIRALARFHRYSLNNVLLILGQRPDASHVAGFKGWIGLGRCVRKGERGIAIFAPCVIRRRGDGEPEGAEDAEETGVTFRIAYVFDLAQTDPIPGHPAPFAPRERPEVAGDDAEAARLFAALRAHLTGSGLADTVAVDAEAVRHPTARGVWYPEARAVAIRPAGPAAMLSTLIHEAAHACVTAAGAELPRAEEEVVAQGAAYVVAAALGIDSEALSAEYVLGWAGGDAAAVKRAAALTQAIAARLLAALDEPAAEPEAVAA